MSVIIRISTIPRNSQNQRFIIAFSFLCSQIRSVRVTNGVQMASNTCLNYLKMALTVFSWEVVVGYKGGLMVLGAVWAVTVAVWDITASISDFAASMCDAHVLCGLLCPLCGLPHPKCGLL